MNKLSDLEYLKLNKFKKIIYKLSLFFCSIPYAFLNFFKKIRNLFKLIFNKIKLEFLDVFNTFKNGDWKTRTSFFILGFGSIARGQILRGSFFLLFQIIFILYTILWGGYYISMLPTLGTVQRGEYEDPISGEFFYTDGDNSFKILLYGVLSLAFIIGFIYTWRVNIKQNKIAQEILDSGKKLKS